MLTLRKFLPMFLIVAMLLGGCSPQAAAPALATEPVLEPAASLAATSTQAPTDAPALAATSTPEGIILPDGLGGEFTLSAPAQRVVSLAPSNSEILFAVGAGAQVVAREDFTNYPEEAVALPSVGGFSGAYDYEAIVGFTPDLVLASPLTSAEQIQTLKDLGLRVMVLPNPTTLDGMYANLQLVGNATGHSAEAETLVLSLQAREKKALEAIATTTERPTVFYELDGTDPAKPWTTGPGTFIDLLIYLAGGENIASALTGEWVQLSLEEIIVQDPDFILLGDSKYGTTPDAVAARAGWENLSAVKNNRVLPFDDDLASRPGPRMIDGLEEMARMFHPEIADQLP